jgi:hypothetical protein
MGKMLADMDALCTFSASDNVVALSPICAGIVFLVDLGPGFGSKTHIPQEGSEVDYFDNSIGC